ncbi:Hairy/enhancer-of-split with YRPW motif protein 2 [Blastocladiella emersonii ATCC 22665]|nr:Hairy/enhancer-of-split with YRPW motif protein 2 [Blastocladiella emersonii ATCC 22665]
MMQSNSMQLLDKWKSAKDGLIHAPRPPLAGKHTGTFAFYTIRDRIPVILTKVINDVNQALFKLPADAPPATAEEGKAVIERLAALRYQMQRDHPMRPLEDSLPDAPVWNEFLATYWPNAGHFQAAWLAQECYVYRRIREALALSPAWADYDPFRLDKAISLEKSIPVLTLLSAHVDGLVQHAAADAADEHARATALGELIMFSLWGNAVDLSLLAGSHSLDTAALGDKMIREAAAGVVVNDLDRVVRALLALRGGRVDFVLDNAGFELTADLLLAEWLVAAGLASHVVFHVKAFPWFVSDTTTADFAETLDTLAPHLPSRVAHWRALLSEGKWRTHVDPFWTLPHAYYHLPSFPVADELRMADFVIFKGDLNYRKLVFDCAWDVTTPFNEAIGPLAVPGVLPPFVSLRTCKSDVCVGLTAETAAALEGVKDWMVSGKHAVISFKE